MPAAPAALNQTDERERLAITTCAVLLERLIAVVQDENELLAHPKSTFHGEHTARKTQLLRDLSLAERGCRSRVAADALLARSRLLRAALARNQKLLAAHIAAVKSVSGIIVDAIRQAESDGTYSRGGYA